MKPLLFLLCLLVWLRLEASPTASPTLEVRLDEQVRWQISSGQLQIEETGPQAKHLAVLAARFHQTGGRWMPYSGVPAAHLAQLHRTAEARLEKEVRAFTSLLLLRLPHPDSVASWRDQLVRLESVHTATAMPEPLPPPAAPDFFPDQQYLQSVPDGIAMATLWEIPGGTGMMTDSTRVKVCDIEYDWNLDHVDLPTVQTVVPAGKTVWSPLADDNHGTAVLGQLASKRDSSGTIGAVYEAEFYVAPSGLDSAWQVGAAILEALTVLGEGDVLVIEHEMAGPTGAAVPIEWWPSWYDAVVTAVGNGVHVVMAAGNGGVNLDDPIFSTGNGGHWPFLPANNSGAIIVGAGAAPGSVGGSDVARSRLDFSNHGSRVDVQGWGERVTTTGYGYAYLLEGKNAWYTRSFGGTSSAVPIVAGAVAGLEGVFREATEGDHVPPALMRDILVATGSVQQAGTFPVTEQIGPLPDVIAAYNQLPISCCVGVTGNVDCDSNEAVTLTDLTRLVNSLFVTFEPYCCPDEANVTADSEGLVNLSDVSRLVNHLFVTFEPLPACP